MSRVRGKNTTPELLLRSILHRAGYRYSLHRKDLPGKPDIVFNSRRKVIFIHGCFWHGHEECNQGRPPKSNESFWSDKLAANRARDRRVSEELIADGWQVYVVWTCHLRSSQKITDAIAGVTRFLEN
jgi:DNA mismatch endonuclease (patch repair protein)